MTNFFDDDLNDFIILQQPQVANNENNYSQQISEHNLVYNRILPPSSNTTFDFNHSIPNFFDSIKTPSSIISQHESKSKLCQLDGSCFSQVDDRIEFKCPPTYDELLKLDMNDFCKLNIDNSQNIDLKDIIISSEYDDTSMDVSFGENNSELADEDEEESGTKDKKELLRLRNRLAARRHQARKKQEEKEHKDKLRLKLNQNNELRQNVKRLEAKVECLREFVRENGGVFQFNMFSQKQF